MVPFPVERENPLFLFFPVNPFWGLVFPLALGPYPLPFTLMAPGALRRTLQKGRHLTRHPHYPQ